MTDGEDRKTVFCPDCGAKFALALADGECPCCGRTHPQEQEMSFSDAASIARMLTDSSAGQYIPSRKGDGYGVQLISSGQEGDHFRTIGPTGEELNDE